MTKDEIQTLMSQSGCIESCLSQKTLWAVVVQLLFSAGGAPTPDTGDKIITEEGDTLITEDGDTVVIE